MRATALDGLWQTIYRQQASLGMRELQKALQSAAPTPYMWFDWHSSKLASLPDTWQADWPTAFCLTTDAPMTPYPYTPMLGHVNTHIPMYDIWQCHEWQMTGLLVFVAASSELHVMPLVHGVTVDVTLPDLHLEYRKSTTGWTWDIAKIGPVNRLIYRQSLDMLEADDLERLDRAVEHTGAWCQRVLGGWVQLLQQPGAWKKLAAKPARIHTKKNGKQQVLRPPMLGYTHYALKGTT
jgi:hypothetical protein